MHFLYRWQITRWKQNMDKCVEREFSSMKTDLKEILGLKDTMGVPLFYAVSMLNPNLSWKNSGVQMLQWESEGLLLSIWAILDPRQDKNYFWWIQITQLSLCLKTWPFWVVQTSRECTRCCRMGPSFPTISSSKTTQEWKEVLFWLKASMKCRSSITSSWIMDLWIRMQSSCNLPTKSFLCQKWIILDIRWAFLWVKILYLETSVKMKPPTLQIVGCLTTLSICPIFKAQYTWKDVQTSEFVYIILK